MRNVMSSFCHLSAPSVKSIACATRQAKIVELLLDAKASVNANDGTGNTALMLACEKGHEATARALRVAGADVNAKDA